MVKDKKGEKGEKKKKMKKPIRFYTHNHWLLAVHLLAADVVGLGSGLCNGHICFITLISVCCFYFFQRARSSFLS